MKRAGFAVVLISFLLGAIPAEAQQRYFIAGFSGVTFNTVTSSDFGGGGGVSLSKHLDLFGEFGRFTDALPMSEKQTIMQNADLVSRDGTAKIIGALPAVYAMAGARLRITTTRYAPYVEAGAGTASVTNNLSVTGSGVDSSARSLTTPLTVPHSQRDALVVLGGGLSIRTKGAFLDVGYRYNHIMTPQPRINVGSILTDVRVTF